MAAAISICCNNLSSISPILSSSFSVSVNDLKFKYVGAAKQSSSPVATASRKQPSTPQTQRYYHPNHNIFKVNDVSQYEERLEKMRELLIESREDDPTESLISVDMIQRLGVAGHYEKEMDKIMMQLQQRYYMMSSYEEEYLQLQSLSLHDAALSFRLLRQRGYFISADVFNTFKGRDGKFRDDLKQDMWGLLELYEATHLSFEGENILREAQHFCSQSLHETVAANTNSKWTNIIKMKLKNPYHKSITAKIMPHTNLVRDVQGMKNTRWISTLTELSVLAFHWGKHIHKDELLQVSMWWNDLGLNRELKLVRNQPVKWYTCSMAILIDDISLSEQRIQLTKSIALIYIIDDIFDLYGTLPELTIFTKAVEKWDYDAMDLLPDYMKLCYKSLLDTTNQIGFIISDKHGHNPINFLKQTWATLCNAFLEEAKWFASKNLPGPEEYLANGMVSSGVHVVLVHVFFLLGQSGTNLDDISTLVSCVAKILRLWDDLGTAKDEHQDGSDGSYIECYMKDDSSSQFEQAREHVVDMIEMEWRRLNKECFNLNNNNYSSFKEAALNLARMVTVLYSYDDKQRLP